MRRRANPGSVHACVSRLFGPARARVRITRVWQEPWDAISEGDARAEGFESSEEFLASFRAINPDVAPGRQVFVVEFVLVERGAS